MCLGEILRLTSVSGTDAEAQRDGSTVAISLIALDDPVVAGDWVLSHSGFALHRLDPGEAQAALATRTSGLRASAPTASAPSASAPIEEDT